MRTWTLAIGHQPSRGRLDATPLTVTHDQLSEDASDELYGGWPMILSALKTRIETGERLDTPASLRFGSA